MNVSPKPRARDLGIPFDGTPGPLNAITDIPGVCVGHQTLNTGTGVRTGVTAILPRGNAGNDIDSYVLAGWSALNGDGEMTGTTWIEESGFLEGPIMLTNTASVGTVRDGVIRYAIGQQGRSAQAVDPDKFGLYLPVVAETYDGHLNDILGFHVTVADASAAIDQATQHNVKEGNVGGGTGMSCYDWKGGIGTSSRTAVVVGAANPAVVIGTFTVGVLVQANQGTFPELVVRGAPVGTELKPPHQLRTVRKSSIIVVIATNAPLLPHQLKRLARRAALGVARTGTITHDDSGEIFVAFSTANQHAADDDKLVTASMIPNGSMDTLFEATVTATEEAIINALIAADTMTGRGGNVATAITDMQDPSLVDVMKKYHRWSPSGTFRVSGPNQPSQQTGPA